MLSTLVHYFHTVPAQFSSVLGGFSSEGLRVLALGYKPVDGSTDLRAIERCVCVYI